MARKRKTDIAVNALGEHIRTMPDGTRRRVHHESPIKIKILATHAENKAKLMGLRQVKIRRIAAKKDRQREKGWPSDKSPI